MLAGHVLLKPGAVLDSDTIEKLREMQIRVLWIRYPALDYVARYISPRIVSEHARLTAMLACGFDEVSRSSHAEVDFRPYSGAVQSLLEEFVSAPQAALFLHEMVDHQHPIMAHSSNVCFLSLLMGLKLEGYLMAQRPRVPPHRARKIASLGVGAMLHDIGMLRLAPEVLERWERTHDERDKEFRAHAKIGFEMARTKIPPTAVGAILHHHQRCDGSGFPSLSRASGPPAPLAGSRIHIFARIVAVADLYDRYRAGPVAEQMNAERGVSERASVPPVRALRRLLDDAAARRIDPVVYRALLSVAPAYSPGSSVRLSDRRTAVVTDWKGADPCRPTVRVIDAVDGTAPVGEPIDLSTHADLTITHTEGFDVTADNFYPTATGPARPGDAGKWATAAA